MKISVNEIFIFENYYKRIGFSKGNSFYAIKQKKNLQLLAAKLAGKIPDPRYAKEHHRSFISKKNTKSVLKSKIITQQLNTFENSNIVDIKSVFIKPLKTSHKLSKTTRLEIFNSLDPGLQLKDTESAMKNKLKKNND